MSHGITERDGVFAVREPMWHGLGTVLNDYPTIEEAQKIAHPWEPVQEPVYRKIEKVLVDETMIPALPYTETEFVEVDDFKAIVRSDTSSTLAVQPSTYSPVSNQTLYDIAEAIEGEAEGSVQLETGGTILGGRKVWLLIRLRDPITVNGDPHGATIPYFALQNAHDGSGSFRGQATFTRIVCDNTSKVADMDAKARGTEFTFRHTQSVHDRIEEAKQALAGWRESVESWKEMNDYLNTLRVGHAQREEFLEEFIPSPPPHTSTHRVMVNVETARQTLRDILDGPTCEGVNGTAYGMVAASVEYLQHYRKARSQETRFKRAMLERNQIISDATDIALRVSV